MDANDTLKTLIYEIRNRKFWTSVSCEYTFNPSPKKKRVCSDEEISKVCQYLEDHPDLAQPGLKGVSIILAKEVLGIDIDSLKPSDKIKYQNVINHVRNKDGYKSIVSKYTY